MNKLVAFSLFCICFLLALPQAALAQTASSQSSEELAVALSQDEDFKNFYLENMRFLKLKETNAVTDAEEKAFHQQQNKRVNNVNSRFPQLVLMEEDEMLKVRQKAFNLVKQKSSK